MTVPVVGGTLAVEADRAVAAEPEQGLLWIVDLLHWEVLHLVELGTGDIPFRIALSGDRAFVTLRGADQIAAVHLDTADVSRAHVCREPRGLTVRGTEVWVACASGDVVVLDHELVEQRRAHVETDLRDIVFADDGLWLSRFRSAELLQVDPATLSVVHRTSPLLSDRTAGTAWRMRPHPDGTGVVLLHQGRLTQQLGGPDSGEFDDSPVGFIYAASTSGDQANACHGIPVTTHVTVATATRTTTGAPLTWTAPMVDFAVADSMAEPVLHVVSTGPASTSYGTLDLGSAAESVAVCGQPQIQRVHAADTTTSVALTGDVAVRFSRHPPALARAASALPLHGSTIDSDRAHAMRLFQGALSPAGACASCHPEGDDDGHTWNLFPLGERRTTTLAGGILDRAPFHWQSELPTMLDILDEVFTERMGGVRLEHNDAFTLGEWMHGIEPVRAHAVDDRAATRGEAVFEDAGCHACHLGGQLTNNERYAVQGNESFKVPTLLGVGSRGPFMHDGCAPTLYDRFVDTRCGGGDRHGQTSDLSEGELQDLVTYLHTL